MTPSHSLDADANRATPIDDAPQSWSPGKRILDNYEIIELLGEGGFGTVHRIHHRGWNVDMAVKSAKALFSKDDERRLHREAEVWIELGLHPNIVSCYFVRSVSGIPRLFIEYVSGGSLHDWLYGRGYVDASGIPHTTLPRRPLALADRLAIAIEICRGMHHAHSFMWRDKSGNARVGIIHRDLKPANILMSEQGTPRITDFGLVGFALPSGTGSHFDSARAAQVQGGRGDSREMRVGRPTQEFAPSVGRYCRDDATATWTDQSDAEKGESPADAGTLDHNLQRVPAAEQPLDSGQSYTQQTIYGGTHGTPAYMAPEQWDKHAPTTKAADVYAFGIILYELFCGRRAFEIREEYRRAAPQFIMSEFKRMHCEQMPPDPALLSPALDAELAQLMIACLQKRPHDRPESFDRIRDTLKAIYRCTEGREFDSGSPEPKAAELLADSLNNRAVSYIELGQFERAKQLLAEASTLNHDHDVVNANHCQLLWLLGHSLVHEATAPLDRLNRLTPSGPVRASLLYLYLETGQSALARELAGEWANNRQLLSTQELTLVQAALSEKNDPARVADSDPAPGRRVNAPATPADSNTTPVEVLESMIQSESRSADEVSLKTLMETFPPVVHKSVDDYSFTGDTVLDHEKVLRALTRPAGLSTALCDCGQPEEVVAGLFFDKNDKLWIVYDSGKSRCFNPLTGEVEGQSENIALNTGRELREQKKLATDPYKLHGVFPADPDGLAAICVSGRDLRWISLLHLSTGFDMPIRPHSNENFLKFFEPVSIDATARYLAMIERHQLVVVPLKDRIKDIIRLQTDLGRFCAARFSPCANMLIAATSTGEIISWSTQSWSVVSSWKFPRPVTALNFRISGDGILLGDDQGIITVTDYPDAEPLVTLRSIGSPVRHVEFLPGGRHVVAGASNGSAYLFDIATGRNYRHWKHGQSHITHLATSRSGSFCATACHAEPVRVWDCRLRGGSPARSPVRFVWHLARPKETHQLLDAQSAAKEISSDLRAAVDGHDYPSAWKLLDRLRDLLGDERPPAFYREMAFVAQADFNRGQFLGCRRLWCADLGSNILHIHERDGELVVITSTEAICLELDSGRIMTRTPHQVSGAKIAHWESRTNHLTVVSPGSTVHRVQCPECAKVWSVSLAPHQISCVWAPDGSSEILAGTDKGIVLRMSADTGQVALERRVGTSTVSWIGRGIRRGQIAAGIMGSVVLCDDRTLEIAGTLSDHPGLPLGAFGLPKSKLFVAIAQDRKWRQWAREGPPNITGNCPPTESLLTRAIAAEDEKFACWAGTRGDVLLMDPQSMAVLRHDKVTASASSALWMSAQGHFIAIGWLNGNLELLGTDWTHIY